MLCSAVTKEKITSLWTVSYSFAVSPVLRELFILTQCSCAPRWWRRAIQTCCSRVDQEKCLWYAEKVSLLCCPHGLTYRTLALHRRNLNKIILMNSVMTVYRQSAKWDSYRKSEELVNKIPLDFNVQYKFHLNILIVQ